MAGRLAPYDVSVYSTNHEDFMAATEHRLQPSVGPCEICQDGQRAMNNAEKLRTLPPVSGKQSDRDLQP